MASDGGKTLHVAPGVTVETKSLADAAACDIAPSPPSLSLALDAGRCERPTRLLFRLPQLTAVMAALDGGAAKVAIELAMSAADLEPARIEWIALLTEKSSGERVFWEKLSTERVVSRADRFERTITCSAANIAGDTGLFLAVQLAGGSGALTFGVVSVAVESVATPAGGLTVSFDRVDGWFKGENLARAELSITSDQGLTAALAIEHEPRDGVVGFSVPRERWSEVLQSQDGGSGAEAFGLTVSGAVVARAWSSRRVQSSQAATARPSPSVTAADVRAALRGTVDPDIVHAELKALYQGRQPEVIWCLQHQLAGSEPSSELTPLRAYTLYYYGRSMLDINAGETAYRSLSMLLDTPELRAVLNGAEQVRAEKLLARACLRSGRAATAILIHRELLADNPVDWEPYNQLGTLEASDPARRRVYHSAAEALATKMPASVISFIAEALLDEGAPEQAIAKVLRELKQTPAANELYLNLANLHLSMGDEVAWSRFLGAFYAPYGLTPPRFTPRRETSRGLFDGAGGSAVSARTRTGPLVTVVMTCFNAEATLASAARSVLAQSHANLRLVIVDDASSDGSRAVIEQLQQEDARVSVLESAVNGGTYVAKNQALKAFDSDYFTFHDSDDWMHPDRLAQHVSLMESRPDIACSTSMWIRMDEGGRAIVRRGSGFVHENPASTFFRGELLTSVGYFDSVRTGADSEFTWRIRRRFGLQSTTEINKPLAVGLHHGASLTQSGPAAFDEHRFSPVRLAYWEAWVKWHERAVLGDQLDKLSIPFPLIERPFEAPPEIAPRRPDVEFRQHSDA